MLNEICGGRSKLRVRVWPANIQLQDQHDISFWGSLWLMTSMELLFKVFVLFKTYIFPCSTIIFGDEARLHIRTFTMVSKPTTAWEQGQKMAYHNLPIRCMQRLRLELTVNSPYVSPYQNKQQTNPQIKPFVYSFIQWFAWLLILELNCGSQQQNHHKNHKSH